MADLFLIAVVAALAIICAALATYSLFLKKQLQETLFSKQSLSVRHGKTAEQWLPYAKDFPFSPESFRFLGNPIDGIAFTEDKIVLVEFKTGNSQLSTQQKRIKELAEKGRVEFREIRA